MSRPHPDPDDAQGLLVRLAHEMRTPLASVLLLAEVLGQREDGPSQHARKIHMATSDALALLNATSDLLKLETGRSRPEAFETDLATLLHGVSRRYRSTVGEAAPPLAVELPTEAADALYLDGRRLGEVLDLLLTGLARDAGAEALSLTAGDPRPSPGGELHLEVEARGGEAGAVAEGLRYELAERLTDALGGGLEAVDPTRLRLRLPLGRPGDGGS